MLTCCLKKILQTGVLLFLLLISLSGKAQKTLARIDNATFYRPGGSPFTEVFIKIPGESLTYQKQKNGQFRAKAKIQLIVLKGKEKRYQKRYNIKTRSIKDTSNIQFTITDQKRIPLKENGNFILFFTIQDAYQPSNKASARTTINANFPKNEPSFSDIKLLDTAYPSTKNTRFSQDQYIMVPKATNIVEPDDKRFFFYSELYNIDRAVNSKNFFINFHLLHGQDTLLTKSKKFKVKPMVQIIANLETSKLNYGKHQVLIEAVSPKNKRIAITGIQIQNRAKGKKDTISLREHLSNYSVDSLLTCIEWLSPIQDRMEAKKADKIINAPSRDTLINYMVEFWEKRDSYNPKKAWLNYKEQVELVNKRYTNPLYKGYETDRGRIYLQYGPPNSILRSKNDPNTYPYEIWHYFRTEKQANIRFVFYSTSILEEEFILLHSNALGEINNPTWKKDLNRSPFEKEDPFGNDPQFDYTK